MILLICLLIFLSLILPETNILAYYPLASQIKIYAHQSRKAKLIMLTDTFAEREEQEIETRKPKPIDPNKPGGPAFHITFPSEDNIRVSKNMVVKGTADISKGQHLWVLAHRADLGDDWWPQGEGRIEELNKEWRVSVVLGEGSDVGWDFEIAVIIVNEHEHLKLLNYRRQAMRSSNWEPIEIPDTLVPPKIRKVRITKY